MRFSGSRAFSVKVDGAPVSCQNMQGAIQGYCEITRVWAVGMTIEADMPMAVTVGKEGL